MEHLSQGSNDLEATPQNPLEDEDVAMGAEPPVSILLVEDEGIVARDLQESLTRLGYHIAGIASEGGQAVSMAEQRKPELVVMDVS
ncbi:MAG: hypothetical protein ACREV5_06385, partial [Steroidobacter sp.]